MYLSAYKDEKLMNFYKGTFRGFHYLLKTHVFVDVIEMKANLPHSGVIQDIMFQ